MRPLRSVGACALVAALALPRAASAQILDSLLIHASARARQKHEQLSPGLRDGGVRQYTEARVDLDSGRWADAILSLTAAMQRGRNNPLYHGEMGYAQARLARWDEAGDAYASAARLQSTNAWWIVALGAIRAAQRRWADAAGTLQLAAQTDTSVVDARFAAIAAQAYEAASDRAKAAEWYATATQLNPEDADSWLRLGLIQRSRSDTAGATTIRRLLRLRPGDKLASAVLATYLSEAGQQDSALALAAAAADDSSYRPYAAEVYLRAGSALLREREFIRAVAVLKRGEPWSAIDLKPTYAFYLGIGEIQLLSMRLNNLQENQSCDSTRGLDTLVARIDSNLRAGRAVDSTRADLLLTQILPGYRTNATQMTARFCDPARRRPAQRPAQRPAPRPATPPRPRP